MRIRVFPLSALLLVACVSATRPDLGAIALGMTRSEVIEKLGKPSQVFASVDTEVLGYEYDRWGDGPYGGAWALVKFKDGRVVEYGEDENFAYSGNPAAATAAGMTAIGAGLALGGAAAGAGAAASRASTNVNIYGR